MGRLRTILSVAVAVALAWAACAAAGLPPRHGPGASPLGFASRLKGQSGTTLLAGARPDEAGRGAGTPAAEAPSAPRRLVIRPNPEADWGGASMADVSKVLRSAADTLWVQAPERRLAPIHVEPKGGPIVLFKRGPGGVYRVRLNTGGTYWAQYAFQFAHEFCHILCRYESTEKANKWFEESVCETASLFALRRMADGWKTHPPYPNWRDFAPHLASYAADRIKTARPPEGTTLAQWYRTHADHLRTHSCDRPKNEIVAGVLLPLFEAKPARWQAVQYLNAGARPEPRTFAAYLADWRRHCPPVHRPFVDKVAARFAIRLPSAPPVNAD